MISMIWVALFVALTGSHLGYGLPVRPTPQTYPHAGHSILEGWTSEGGMYAAIPALALVFVALAFLFGCTWCYRHKDCKPNEGAVNQPNEGADNQLFTASASHIHTPQRLQPPDSGFSEPVNNNVSEDNNNGPISLREMQNIANNNAGGYIYNENEERNANRFNSRESIVLFDPLPVEIHADDPLEPYTEWFTSEHLPRDNLQYLRELGRGWFGRVVAGEIEDENGAQMVAVKLLNQNATLEDKARFLEETRMYRELKHEQILKFLGKCMEEEPWLLIFELCTVDLQTYLIINRPEMSTLYESGVPLQLMSDVSSALAYMHSHGFTYGYLWGGSVLVRGEAEAARALLGRYQIVEPQHDCFAPEVLRRGAVYTPSSEIWSLGTLIWEVCSWGSIATDRPSPPTVMPCPYKNHLYQVMQLCWNLNPEERPTASQVHALIDHLHTTLALMRSHGETSSDANIYESSDFEARWQRLKPNSIPKVDEHIAIVHAPSTSAAHSTHFTESEQGFENTLSVDMDTAVSRSSSIMSDKDPLESQIRSESLTNLHGSLEDVGNIYLMHNETAALECNQGNVLEDAREKENDRSDSSVDPWLKEIIAGSQDDVSYYRDVSDVIKNLDNILNSEKTSSSESSHQASPSRDNLSLDCKKDYPMQSSMVKSPGITNFQNLIDTGFASKDEDTENADDELDRETIGTLSHSFERHSDTTSQQTLENITPDTPMKDINIVTEFENIDGQQSEKHLSEIPIEQKSELPNEIVDRKVPKLKKLCVVSMPSLSEPVEQFIDKKDCETSCDIAETRTENEVPKSLVDVAIDTESMPLDEIEITDSVHKPITDNEVQIIHEDVQNKSEEIPPKFDETQTITDGDDTRTETTELETVTDELRTEIDEIQTETDADTRTKTEEESVKNDDETKMEDIQTVTDEIETETDLVLSEADEMRTKSEETKPEAVEDAILPVNVKEVSHETDTLPSVSEKVSNTTEASQLNSFIDDIEPEITESENNYSRDETILVSDIIDIDSSKDKPDQAIDNTIEVVEQVILTEKPVLVQKLVDGNDVTIDIKKTEIIDLDSKTVDLEESESNYSNATENDESILPTDLPPEIVQNTNNTSVCETENLVDNEKINEKIVDRKDDNAMLRSDSYVVIDLNEQSNDSTVYMDLINNTNSQILNSTVDNNLSKDIENQETTPGTYGNESTQSTVYMDLPSLEIIKKTDDFLHSERMSSDQIGDKIFASTPITSDGSLDTLETLEHTKENETLVLSETKAPDYEPGMSVLKLEQKYVPENMSPFDSPTKSHHTDTFDENSSVVLGSFENCSLELFKGKSSVECVELPKEELLAFSSNFSEINLETPSPLRDSNFLNEVPDIMPDAFDDLVSITEPKESGEPPSTDGSGPSGTEKHVSPSTPPNSPGIFLASTSEPKYVVDIDLNESTPVNPPTNSVRDEIQLNQIELQITSKMAMAENENNMNIEYSGPLTVEGLIEEGGMMRESDAIPESFLAGNGESVENLRENLLLDEESVKALRNELELKLPLAQVASIEPQCESEGEWPSELPPPPELIVNYPGALSPIVEETGQQLSAYDNDLQWNPSTRTDSSESYPEPCNNSTDDATELPTGNQEHTYRIPSRDNSHSHNTYTVCKEAPASSRDLTMSADSLNASPLKILDALSPIDDQTYTKEDDKESNCERISQVSPFLVSPTTDTAPDTSENATRISTSKTTLPTDAKHSKTETQCLSKATSIDSWCSNDTLYNVEENFDDLAMDPVEFEPEGNSDSTDTLHNEDDRELSHCSTYIIHDSKSEPCETFSPDSITANDNHTYTKVKETGTTPSATDVNDSKNTTKDLAYETLTSGMPSYSNCTTELASVFEDAWKLPQPELVRRSPVGDVTLSPQKQEDKECHDDTNSPKVTEHSLKKMDSVEISCLEDNLTDTTNRAEENQEIIIVNDSPNCNYRNMMPSVTSTPLVEVADDADNCEVIPMQLPQVTDDSEHMANVPSFCYFQQSAEIRPQDLSTNMNSVNDTKQDTEVLLEGDSKTLSRNSNSIQGFERTPNYSDFENSAVTKPQDLNSRDRSSQSTESGVTSEEFKQFENSVRDRPQDLSSLIDASSLLLRSERFSGELAMGYSFYDQTSQSNSNCEPMQFLISPPTTNLIESNELIDASGPSTSLLINFGPEDETEQPHSIIVTEVPMSASKISPNRTFDSHAHSNYNQTYDSHEGLSNPAAFAVQPKVNGVANCEEIESLIEIGQQNTVILSPKPEEVCHKLEDVSPKPEEVCHKLEDVSPKPEEVCHKLEDVSPKPEEVCHKLEDVSPKPEEVCHKLEDVSPKPEEISLKSEGMSQETIEVSLIPEVMSLKTEILSPKSEIFHVTENINSKNAFELQESHELPNRVTETKSIEKLPVEVKVNGNGVNIATVNFLSETFEELIESNVDDGDGNNDTLPVELKSSENIASPIEDKSLDTSNHLTGCSANNEVKTNGETEETHKEATEDFLKNEKEFCQLDSFLPLMSDIRFTGPATEIMSTSFSQDSPTEPTSPECEQDSKPNAVAEILKEWDSDSESHSSNSSSGEFIWKDGDGHETSVVPTTHFDHQRGSGAPPSDPTSGQGSRDSDHGSEGSGDSCSGSEGDEVEFVPSSWDCRAAPAKSSLRSLEQTSLDAGEKKRVVFKRQKYHCVYEYPREALDLEPNSPAYLPDLSTYSEWDPTSAEEAELCYGHLFSMPSALSAGYPMRAGIAFGSDYDEDFYISSSARPFESLGIMSTASQFFPGMHVKPALERELPEDFPAPPSPLPTTLVHSRTPSLDFTTPDSGVEDITPGSVETDEDFKKKIPETELSWRPVDSTSSSESVSPSSPGGEALGGLRHTRDKLKLDLPPSPHVPSPRHNRVFNFVLDKPKRKQERTVEIIPPLIMTDETPVTADTLPIQEDLELPIPEPTFSTFGKSVPKSEPEQKIILDEAQSVQKIEPEKKIILDEVRTEDESPKVVEPVKGEGTVLDSGDEDSGIESSSKATLERKTNVS